MTSEINTIFEKNKDQCQTWWSFFWQLFLLWPCLWQIPQDCIIPFFVSFPSEPVVGLGSFEPLTLIFLGLPDNLGTGGGSIGSYWENFWNLGPGTGRRGCSYVANYLDLWYQLDIIDNGSILLWYRAQMAWKHGIPVSSHALQVHNYLSNMTVCLSMPSPIS